MPTGQQYWTQENLSNWTTRNRFQRLSVLIKALHMLHHGGQNICNSKTNRLGLKGSNKVYAMNTSVTYRIRVPWRINGNTLTRCKQHETVEWTFAMKDKSSAFKALQSWVETVWPQTMSTVTMLLWNTKLNYPTSERQNATTISHSNHPTHYYHHRASYLSEQSLLPALPWTLKHALTVVTLSVAVQRPVCDHHSQSWPFCLTTDNSYKLSMVACVCC